MKSPPCLRKINLVLLIVFSAMLAIPSFLYAQESSKEDEVFFVARKAFDDGFYDVSLGLLERFLKNYPTSSRVAEIHLLVGQCYFHQGGFLDALEKFEKLLDRPDASAFQDAVLYWIAEVHFRGNNFSKAADFYRKIIDAFPQSSYVPAAYYSLGWCFFQERLFADALEYFKTVEQKFPKESLTQDVSFKIVECLYNLKDYPALKNAVLSYAKAYIKDKVKWVYFTFYLAESEYYLNNFQAAIDGYTQVIVKGSDDRIRELARLGIGWSHLKLKQYREAESYFSQVQGGILEKTSKDMLLLGEAILMVETNRFAEARRLYDALLVQASDSVVLLQGYVGKAELLYSMGQYQSAISVYQEALSKITGAFASSEIVDKLHYGLAWAYLKYGEFKSAIEEFQKIAKYTEDKIIKVAALCQIGDAYQDSGDFQKAIETYDSILKDYPDNLYSDYVQYELGLTLLKTSNYEGAIMALRALKTNYPASKLLDDATYALGLSYFQREDYTASYEIFGKFPVEFPDSPLRAQSMYLLGTSLYNLEKFSEAIEAFKNVIKAYSQDTELVQKAEYEIADCFYQMGNEKEAMERFKSLRAKYPDSSLTPEVMWWLGEYHYRHNELAVARRYFSSLVQDFPQSSLIADAYYALGSISQEEGKFEEAKQDFKKVMTLSKSDFAGTAAIAIADMQVRQGLTNQALEMYKEILTNYAHLAYLVYPKMADIYQEIGRHEEALDLYHKTMAIAPSRQAATIQFKIGEIKEAQGKKKEAIEEYLKVTYLYPQDNSLTVKALLRIASLYEAQEDFMQAQAAYEKIAVMNVEESKYARERIDWISAHVK